MRLAGCVWQDASGMMMYCQRHDDEIAHDILFWDPKHGQRGRGRPHINYIDMRRQDTRLDPAETQNLMNDRVLWRERIKDRAQHSK